MKFDPPDAATPSPFPLYREPSGRIVGVVAEPREAGPALALLREYGVEAVVRRA